MKKVLFALTLATLLMVACKSKTDVSFGTMSFRYTSDYTLVKHEVAENDSSAVLLFKNKKDSLEFLFMQVVMEDTTKITFNGDTCALSKMTPRNVGKYLAEKTFEIYQEHTVPADSTSSFEYSIDTVDDLRILIDDPKVIEVGAFAKGKVNKKPFSSGIRGALFNGFRITAYAQGDTDKSVDGLFEIFTSAHISSAP